MQLLKILLFFFFAFIAASAISAQDDYKQYLDLSYAEIDSLMYIEYSNGAFAKAIPLMQAGRDKAKIDFGGQDSIFAEYTNNLGFFYTEIGQYDKAVQFYTEAKNIREKVFGVEHPYFAQALNNLALLHHKMGNYEKALPLLIQAKNIETKFGLDSFLLPFSLNNLAGLHEAMGNYEKALPLFTQAKNIREKTLGVEHPDFAASLNNLALLHYKMGNYEKALPLLIQAKNIREKILGVEHPSFAASLNNLASLHNKMGNYKKALPLFTQAKNIYAKVLGIEHPSFATSLNNLASSYNKMGNYEKALLLLIQAKNIREKILGVEHPDFAASLNNLASLHKDMRNYEKALPLLIQAKNIREKILGVEHPDFALSLNSLAALHQAMGDYEKAWTTLLEAIEVASSLKLNQNIRQTWADSLLRAPYSSNAHIERTIESLKLVYELLQKDKSITESKEKQWIVANLATQLLHKLRQEVSNEKDKLIVLKLSSAWLERSLSVLNKAEHSAKAFELADQNKSVLLLQATKSGEVYKLSNLPDSLVSKDKKMLKTQSQLQAKLMERRPKEEKDSLHNLLNHLHQDIDDFAQMIKIKYPKYHKLKYQQVDAKLNDIQALLEENTALLEYVVGDSVVHIFYVDKTQVQWKKTFVANDTLKNHIDRLHNALSNYKVITKDQTQSYHEYTRQAYWFYTKLLAPVLKDKASLQKLVIVTDGEIGHLPFETFLVEQAPEQVSNYKSLHYLVKDYNISYNYSATLWKENIEAPSPENNGEIFAMAANYNLKLDSAMRDVRLLADQSMRRTLNPLPSARKEVETLQEKYKGFFAFDTLAAEKTVKAKAGNFAILHFATHGYPNNKDPELSWLAFSEDNDSIESNFWQAHEISKMELNANLVVLSACETGFGEFQEGNGIASLARAFMNAGAPALIVSLWQVNDQATSLIMENLYNNLANGMKKDEALQQAKIQYMEKAKGIAAHPAFWSPFIMMGNTESVSIMRKGNSSSWLIAGLVGLSVLGVGFMVSKRRRKKEVA